MSLFTDFTIKPKQIKAIRPVFNAIKSLKFDKIDLKVYFMIIKGEIMMKALISIILFFSAASSSAFTLSTQMPTESDYAISVTNLICNSSYTNQEFRGEVHRLSKDQIEYRVYDLNGKLVASALTEKVTTADGLEISPDNIPLAKKECSEIM